MRVEECHRKNVIEWDGGQITREGEREAARGKGRMMHRLEERRGE